MEQVWVRGVLDYQLIEEDSGCRFLVIKLMGKHFDDWETRRIRRLMGPMEGQGVDLKLTCYTPKSSSQI